MSETKYYRIDLEVNGGIAFWVTRQGDPKLDDTPNEVSEEHVSQGASVDLAGALNAIEDVLLTATGGQARTKVDGFSTDERMLLAYGLGLAAKMAEPEILKALLAKLGVQIDAQAMAMMTGNG